MQRNIVKHCKVCESAVNVGFHYGVCTCRACGAFFRYFLIKFNLKFFIRRYIENEGECKYKCKCLPKQLLKENKDGKSETNSAKCKKCRLEKCLSVGMKKLDVRYLRHDICQEAMREQNNEVNLPNHPTVDITIKDQNLINSILPIIEAKKRIMHAFNDLDDIFLNGPILFEEIILSNFNIFRLTGTFSSNPSTIFFDELNSLETSIQTERIVNSRVEKCLLVDRLLCVGLAKSMPVFEKLTLSDQIAHLRQICHLFGTFTNTYLAWELGSETWKRKNNFMHALNCKKDPVYLNDDKMIKSTDLLFTKSVAHFKRASLTKVEFALLIAIILSKSGGQNLSPEGKELLYNESNKYTQILLRYNQRRLGLTEGALRLAECCQLISRSIENEYNGRLIISHHIKHYSMDGSYLRCSNFMKKVLERSG